MKERFRPLTLSQPDLKELFEINASKQLGSTLIHMTSAQDIIE
jgi:hypothetical protein